MYLFEVMNKQIQLQPAIACSKSTIKTLEQGVKGVLPLRIRVATSIFDHAQPKIFQSTFNFHEFVSECKESGYFIKMFWRYRQFENPAI